jgi:hypothetical protein
MSTVVEVSAKEGVNEGENKTRWRRDILGVVIEEIETRLPPTKIT